MRRKYLRFEQLEVFRPMPLPAALKIANNKPTKAG